MKKETEAEKTARLKALRLAQEKKKGKPRQRGKVWSLSDELPFGKHKDKTIAEVIEEDRGWIKWALENVEGFLLDNSAQLEFDSGDDIRRPPKAWESPRY